LRLQRLAGSVLREVALRWPELARLVGVAAPFVPTEPAGSPRDAAPSVASEQAGRSRTENLALLREGPDFGERARAAQALGRVVDDETTGALIAALRDASSEVAVRAAEALASHGGDAAIVALQGVVQNVDGYVRAETRASAVRTLGLLLPANQGTAIAAAVADADATVSLAAIAALAERDEAISANALLGVLEDQGHFYLPLTRHAAARALLHLRRYDEQRVRALLEQESDAAVRETLVSLGWVTARS
jgi:HEAT repeat protein